MKLSSTTLAMLLADSRLPVGAHVVSNGLEAALRGGMAPELAPEYMCARMATTVLVEAGTAIVTRALVAAGEIERIARVRSEWEARTPSRALREIAIALGDGLARMGRTVWPESLLAGSLPARGLPRPLVLGVLAAEQGLEAGDLARLVAYEDAQTVAAALLKLEPLDPATAVRWALEACEYFGAYAPSVAVLTEPEAIPAFSGPQIEEWAEAHTSLERRLFRA